MKRWAMVGTAWAAILAFPDSAGASGDYGCTPRWSLAVSSYDCAGSAVIGPRNDTRMNLALLLRQGPPGAPAKASYPTWDWDNGDFGHVFVDWDGLQSAFWPKPETPAGASDEQPEYSGSRCQTLAGGAAAFREALAQAKGLRPEDRETLGAARDLVKSACDGDKGPAPWPTLASSSAQSWLSYLQGARAFYADDFATSRERFAGLVRTSDPWLSETARYMIARNELAAAQVGAFDEWGGYAGGDKVDRPSAERARAALRDYLTVYPKGRYASSASGLMRRAAWLLGDRPALAQAYTGLLRDPSLSPAALEEVESKMFFGVGIGDDGNAPLLLATWDLLRMRQAAPDPYGASEPSHPLTAQELAGQERVFSEQPELYAFLQASYAYHVAKDYRRVLALVPDDARAARFTPLGFSSQMLRGLALAKLDDLNTTGFYRQLLGGAKDLYQRPAVELALAMLWERSGALAKVFAPGSPIIEREIRTMLLAHLAAPELLRGQTADANASQAERSVAAFTLLAKHLSQRRYGDFGGDLKRVPRNASTSGWVGSGWSSGWLDPSPDGGVPLGLFTKGKVQEGFSCPALVKTAEILAANPAQSRSRLCLAEFWRLNDFDGYLGAVDRPGADELGGTPDLFPGKMAPRSALYSAVLADRSAAADETAYALYRSVQCYAPSRNNACGGPDVPVAQRKAWFQRLKRDYPQSKWAIDLRYYW